MPSANNLPPFPTVSVTDINNSAVRAWWDAVRRFGNELTLQSDSFGTGLMTKTGDSTYSSRTIIGTNGIEVTNGNGVSGNPTVEADINGLTQKTSFNTSSDTVMVYKADEGTNVKANLASLVSSVSTVQIVSSTYSSYTSTSAHIPYDNTIPQVGEGLEILSVAITPRATTSTLIIEGVVSCTTNASADVILAVFQDGVADAIVATDSFGVNGAPLSIPIRYVMAAGTTLETVFTLRVGTNLNTLYLNGNDTNRIFGGVSVCTLTVTEVG